MSDNGTYIPRRLDDPWKLGLWDMDVAIPFLFAFMLAQAAIGGITGWLVGVPMGLLAGKLMSRTKAARHPAFLFHWAYWHLPTVIVRLDCTPPSCIRRMVG